MPENAPRRIRFYLDYGVCFWSAAPNVPGYSLFPEDLPLSLQAQQETRLFLQRYDAHYDFGCPPHAGWSVEDCREFNRQYRRILEITSRELGPQYLVCNEQIPLSEEQPFLDELAQRGQEFYTEQARLYAFGDAR